MRDSNPTTYTVYYRDGRVSTGHSYLESCEMCEMPRFELGQC